MWAALAGCGPELSGEYLGQSTHFRLYVDRELTLMHPAFTAEGGLAALETNWSDTQTLLKMPEARIDYHWVTPPHAAEACGAESVPAGCKFQGGVVVSTVLPHQHELNHAYMELRSHRRPVPFLSEGMAEAIGCGNAPGTPTVTDEFIPWQALVAATTQDPNSADLYARAGLLVRHLIRTGGIDRVLAYYQQAPEIRDPAIFVENFSRFWQASLDEVWEAIHTQRSIQRGRDSAICPCSLDPLILNGVQPPPHDPVRAPYWTIPDLGGMTLALQSTSSSPLQVAGCQGNAATVLTAERFVLARLDQPSYVMSPVQRAVSANFISETCEGAAPYQIPTTSGALVRLQIAHATLSAGTLAVYLRLQVPAASRLTSVSISPGSFSVCDSCAFDSLACQEAVGTAPITRTALVRIPIQPQVPGDAAPALRGLAFF